MIGAQPAAIAKVEADTTPKDKTTTSGQQVATQMRGLRKNLVELKKQLFAEALARDPSDTDARRELMELRPPPP